MRKHHSINSLWTSRVFVVVKILFCRSPFKMNGKKHTVRRLFWGLFLGKLLWLIIPQSESESRVFEVNSLTKSTTFGGIPNRQFGRYNWQNPVLFSKEAQLDIVASAAGSAARIQGFFRVTQLFPIYIPRTQNKLLLWLEVRRCFGGALDLQNFRRQSNSPIFCPRFPKEDFGHIRSLRWGERRRLMVKRLLVQRKDDIYPPGNSEFRHYSSRGLSSPKWKFTLLETNISRTKALLSRWFSFSRLVGYLSSLEGKTKRPPSCCLGDFLGMTSYSAFFWGLVHKPTFWGSRLNNHELLWKVYQVIHSDFFIP